MKIQRFLLAAAVALAATACARDATAPEPAVRAPQAAPGSDTDPLQPTGLTPPTTGGGDDATGGLGSGCCFKP